jgi:hypothetical protein
VVALVGFGVAGAASSKASNLRSRCDADGNTDCNSKPGPGFEATEQEVADGNAARTRAQVGGLVGVVGLGAAAGFVIYYFVQPLPKTTTTAQRIPVLTPELAPGFAGLSLSGRF